MGNIDKFEAVANSYDTPERIGISKIIAEALRPCIENGDQKTAIDFGCGTGLIGMELLKNFKSVLFIDASPNMARITEQKLRQSNMTNSNVLCCNIEENTPPDLRADYIIMAQVLLHIKNIEPVLAQMHAMLNEGGHLLVVDFDKNEAIVSADVHNGFEQESLNSLLKRLGFINLQSRTFFHGKKMFMNTDASLFLLDAVK